MLAAFDGKLTKPKDFLSLVKEKIGELLRGTKGVHALNLGQHSRPGGVPATNVAFSQHLQEMGAYLLASFF